MQTISHTNGAGQGFTEDALYEAYMGWIFERGDCDYMRRHGADEGSLLAYEDGWGWDDFLDSLEPAKPFADVQTLRLSQSSTQPVYRCYFPSKRLFDMAALIAYLEPWNFGGRAVGSGCMPDGRVFTDVQVFVD